MKTIYYLNILITLLVILFLADIYTAFGIKNMTLRYIIYTSFILSPIIIIFNLILISNLKIKLLSFIIPVFTLVFSLSIGYMPIIFNSANWKTQTIIYQNIEDDNLTIEYQIQDVGAFGYNKRTVIVYDLLGLFAVIKPTDIDTISKANWNLLNKHINEMELKGG